MAYESFRLSKGKAYRQIFSYALIGLLTNLLGYCLYRILTYFRGAPKLTMTVLYSASALISFFANRHFTFRHDGRVGVAGIRVGLNYPVGGSRLIVAKNE